MKVHDTNIPDVKILSPTQYGDDRGFFMETFVSNWFKSNISDFDFVQDNHSKSCQGILRGLHYQIDNPQGKLVRVVSGDVFDVAVDLRLNSKTFSQSVCVRLSSDNNRMLWIPPGFAHGFYVLSEYAEFVYKCTSYYDPDSEKSIIWNDPDLKINWPLIKGLKPNLSQKDSQGLLFKEAPKYG